jgi:DNA modification methylase
MSPEIIGNATLYLGDCREILPTLGKVDAVVTDPPYGIGFAYESHKDDAEGWFKLMHEVVPVLKLMAPAVVMPSAQKTRLGWWYANYPPDWLLAWVKGSPTIHTTINGFEAWEAHLFWGRPPGKIHDVFHAPTLGANTEDGHPCPKPPSWGRWLVSRMAVQGATVLDPFMGSGTTGVACANLGRKFIGIEIEPKYFDIACERIRAAQAQQRLFA